MAERESRDPYVGLLGRHVDVTLRNGLSYKGVLELATYSFIRLLDNGDTCVLRRDVIDVIRTARVDSPQTRDVLRTVQAGVGKVQP